MEHLLDDDQDMAHLYLTRKNLIAQEEELNAMASPPNSPRLSRLSSRRSGNTSFVSSGNDDNVEELEMLLEAYFVQIDGTRKKILAVCSFDLSAGNLFSISALLQA
jgi:magnesium transporter